MACGAVLAEIRGRLGIERVPEDVILETRRRKWNARIERAARERRRKLVYRRVLPRVSSMRNEYGPLADLKRICRRNGWEDPKMKSLKAKPRVGKRVRVSINTGEKQISVVGKSLEGRDRAIDSAVLELFEALTQQFSSSEDRRALTADKTDNSTPLGLLLSLFPEAELIFRNQHHNTLVYARVRFDGETYKGCSEPAECERVAANQAAASLLRKIVEAHPEQQIPELQIPEAPELAEDVPLGHLCCEDPIKELRLLCLEQGHEEPTYKANLNASKGRTAYTCTVRTKEGDVITKRAIYRNGETALSVSAAYMLQHMRPAYRGGPLYKRKVELLRERHGVDVEEPKFTEIPSPVRPDKMEHECHVEFSPEEDVVIEGDAIRYTPIKAEDAACRWFLSKYWKHHKSELWKKRMALRKAVRR